MGEDNSIIDLGDLSKPATVLTKIGKELAPISGSEPDSDFKAYVINKWRSFGCEVKEVN